MVSASSLVPKLRFGNRGDSGNVVNAHEQNDATNGDSEIDLESPLCTDFSNNATLQNVSRRHQPLMVAPPPPPVTAVRHHNPNAPFHSPYAGLLDPRPPPGALPASLRRPLIPEPRMARLGMPLGHLDRIPVQPPSLVLDSGVSRDVSVLGRLQAPGMQPSSGQPGPWSPIGHPNMVPSQYVKHDGAGGSPSQTCPVRPLHQVSGCNDLQWVFPRTSPTPTMTAPTAIGSDQSVSMSCMPFVGPDANIESSGLPHPTQNSTSVVMHETCQNILYSPLSDGSCSPSHMRCTMNQVPCTNDLLETSSMPLSLIIQPLALPRPSEEPVKVVDFGESGPVRCRLCKAYINPFMKFINRGTHFICNLCEYINETPGHYNWSFRMDGMRNGADKSPELCNGTVEFVATKDYMIRDHVHGVYVFLIDISIDAVNTGATAAACGAIKQVIGDLPEGPRTMVGLITYDRSIQFYKLKCTSKQPEILIVSGTDVFTPLHTDLIVNLSECRQCLEEVLENIPSMFEGSNSIDSAFGAAVKAGCLLLESTGGKLLVFQSVLPSIGVGALSARQNEWLTVSSWEKASQKLLQPADNFLNSLAIELAKCQVRVDIFLTTQTYADVASISVIPKMTGGQMYYYNRFSTLLHSAKLYNDLKWNITRLQGSEAVMSVRCSTGLQVEEYSGNFYMDCPNLFFDWKYQSSFIGFSGIDCEKTIMVTVKHYDKLKGPECSFQCALVYTTIDGQRRIRVNTVSLPTTTALENMFHSADAETQLSCFSRKVANEITTSSPLQVRERLTDICINILHSYRKSCATMSDPTYPGTLSLLSLYILALSKSIVFQSSGWVDEKSYWISCVSTLPISLVVPLVYPRMMAIHHLLLQADGSLKTPRLPLSSELVTEDGIFLLENGEDVLIYVGDAVNPFLLQQLFGIFSIGGLTQLVLQQYDNPSSRKLNELIYGIRRLRRSYLCLKFCRKGDPSGLLFKSFMLEDGIGNEPSYKEFLLSVIKKIRAKLSNGR